MKDFVRKFAVTVLVLIGIFQIISWLPASVWDHAGDGWGYLRSILGEEWQYAARVETPSGKDIWIPSDAWTDWWFGLIVLQLLGLFGAGMIVCWLVSLLFSKIDRAEATWLDSIFFAVIFFLFCLPAYNACEGPSWGVQMHNLYVDGESQSYLLTNEERINFALEGNYEAQDALISERMKVLDADLRRGVRIAAATQGASEDYARSLLQVMDDNIMHGGKRLGSGNQSEEKRD